MRCALSPRCDMDRVVKPEALTPAQRANLVLCEVHSRHVADAMDRVERARTLALLTQPAPPPPTVEQVVLRLCSKKNGATYEAIKAECGTRLPNEIYETFRRLVDEKKIVPRGGKSRGSFKTAAK